MFAKNTKKKSLYLSIYLSHTHTLTRTRRRWICGRATLPSPVEKVNYTLKETVERRKTGRAFKMTKVARPSHCSCDTMLIWYLETTTLHLRPQIHPPSCSQVRGRVYLHMMRDGAARSRASPPLPDAAVI